MTWDDGALHDDEPTFPCPHCGEDIYDDTERCPACGKYLSREDAPTRLRPLWILIGIAICILIVLSWVLGG